MDVPGVWGGVNHGSTGLLRVQERPGTKWGGVAGPLLHAMVSKVLQSLPPDNLCPMTGASAARLQAGGQMAWVMAARSLLPGDSQLPAWKRGCRHLHAQPDSREAMASEQEGWGRASCPADLRDLHGNEPGGSGAPLVGLVGRPGPQGLQAASCPPRLWVPS